MCCLSTYNQLKCFKIIQKFICTKNIIILYCRVEPYCQSLKSQHEMEIKDTICGALVTKLVYVNICFSKVGAS